MVVVHSKNAHADSAMALYQLGNLRYQKNVSIRLIQLGANNAPVAVHWGIYTPVGEDSLILRHPFLFRPSVTDLSWVLYELEGNLTRLFFTGFVHGWRLLTLSDIKRLQSNGILPPEQEVQEFFGYGALRLGEDTFSFVPLLDVDGSRVVYDQHVTRYDGTEEILVHFR